MILSPTVFATILLIGGNTFYCRSTPEITDDLILKFPELDPENAATQPRTGMVYLSRTYKASVVKYDPVKQTFKEIRIPSITGRAGLHVSGIEADRSRSMIWAIVDAAAAFETNGTDLSGPSGLLGINANDEVVNNIDLLPALAVAQQLNGGHKVGGTQDATTDHEGNVYVIMTFGEVIIKVDRKTMQPSILFARMNPAPTGSYTGIELADANTLIMWNDRNSRLETFNLHSANTQPCETITSPKINPNSISGDSVFIPTFSKGSCLLLANYKTSSIEVFTTKDAWKSAHHSKTIPANRLGGHPEYTFELGSKIYCGIYYLPKEQPKPHLESPQVDITHAVKSACSIFS